MPVYNVAIAYTERLTRTNTVLVRADTNEEAEAFARRGFRRSQEEGPATVQIQGKDLGFPWKWEAWHPVEKTFVVVGTLRTED